MNSIENRTSYQTNKPDIETLSTHFSLNQSDILRATANILLISLAYHIHNECDWSLDILSGIIIGLWLFLWAGAISQREK